MCFSVIEFVVCPFYNIRDTGLKIVLLYAESHGYMDGNIFIAYNTFAYCDVDFIHKDSGIIKIHFGKKEKKFFPSPSAHVSCSESFFSE